MPAHHELSEHERDLDYGGKSRDMEALDSAMMMGVVMLLTVVLVIGLGIGVALTLWLT
jgi:hypothetical protein